jgi:hypothetical protein
MAEGIQFKPIGRQNQGNCLQKEIGTTRAKAATIGIPHVSQRAASELIMDD